MRIKTIEHFVVTPMLYLVGIISTKESTTVNCENKITYIKNEISRMIVKKIIIHKPLET